jgi:PiT family inorganic phosphate transporter
VDIIIAHGLVFVGLAVAFGLYMTWGIGANDVANAMGTSVGSGAITIKQAILIAAVFEFAGVMLAGGHVTSTIRKGVVDSTPIIESPELLVYGMLAALLSAAIWLMIASWKGWPVSTTHSIVGSLVGFALVGIGESAVQWGTVTEIAASWIVSPLIGGLFAYFIMRSIRAFILDTDQPFRNSKRWGPFYVFLVGFLIALVTLFKGLSHLQIPMSAGASIAAATGIGILTGVLGWVFIRKRTIDETADRQFHYHSVEKVFGPLQVFTACAMAFAHGSNDVANGIGPLAAIVSIVRSGGEVSQTSPLPLWILLLGGLGIVTGLATFGYRVMSTIGKKITELTPTRGFSAELAAAATVVFASRIGLPVSTTHIIVGAVMGVGFARGIGSIDLRVIGKIIVSWLVTLPVGAGLAAVVFYVLRGVFGG